MILDSSSWFLFFCPWWLFLLLTPFCTKSLSNPNSVITARHAHTEVWGHVLCLCNDSQLIQLVSTSYYLQWKVMKRRVEPCHRVGENSFKETYSAVFFQILAVSWGLHEWSVMCSDQSTTKMKLKFFFFLNWPLRAGCKRKQILILTSMLKWSSLQHKLTWRSWMRKDNKEPFFKVPFLSTRWLFADMTTFDKESNKQWRFILNHFQPSSVQCWEM